MRALGLCLLALCACKNVDIPWQRPACAPLQLQGDPPELAVLVNVRPSGHSLLALSRGVNHPDDPLLLSVFDGQSWHQPYRLLEYSDELQRAAISSGGVLLFTIDYQSVEWQDSGTRDLELDAGPRTMPTPMASFETQLTLVNDACNRVPLIMLRAHAERALSALTNNGLAALAWNTDDGDVEAAVVRAAQEPARATLAKAADERTPGITLLTALSDNSMVAAMIELGRSYADPQRLLTRRFSGRGWQDAVEHGAAEHVENVVIAGATVAAGPGSIAALSWVDATSSEAVLRMQRTDDGVSWSDPVALFSAEPPMGDVQSLFAADGTRLAVLWRHDDTWRALIVESDDAVSEAIDTGCSDYRPPSAVFDPRGQLLIACGNDEGPATLTSFDGTTVSATQLGEGDGAATQPKLTAVPAGPIMALWEQHDGPAHAVVDDAGVRTSATIVSAMIVDGEAQDAEPIIP